MKLRHALPLACALAAAAAPASAAVPTVRLPPIDFAKVNAEDARAKESPGAIRYAVPRTLDASPATAGIWEHGKDGRSRWQLRVVAPDAVHLNFGFTRFRLPSSATLRLVGPDGRAQFRAFTAADNDAHGQLWTPPVLGTSATIELTVATRERAAVELVLGRVGQGYRGFGRTAAGAKSGSCNTDVACLASDDAWTTVQRAVGVMSDSGFRYCTGSLVNNTANDRRMYFITATHCEVDASNAASLVVVWNFEAPSCRQPGSAASGSDAVVGSLAQFNTGAIFRAATQDPFAGGASGPKSDTTLVELDDPADPSFALYWAGWNRDSTGATCSALAPCASIHHPSGDEKRITFSHDDLVVGDIDRAQDVHWFVQWANPPPVLPGFSSTTGIPPSVTERGSSGSPLYDASQRLVGVLSGGASFCGASNASLNDLYGQLAHAWDGLGTDSTRMRTWLDPLGTNAVTLPGLDAAPLPDALFDSGFEDGE